MVRRPPADPLITTAAMAALEKKAEEIALLDLRGLSDVTDYFLICHGRSGRQVQTIADNIERVLREGHRRPNHVEGYARGEWILMDYLDFVIHVFTVERRGYYALERLWGDAPRVAVRSTAGRARRRSEGGDAGDAIEVPDDSAEEPA